MLVTYSSDTRSLFTTKFTNLRSTMVNKVRQINSRIIFIFLVGLNSSRNELVIFDPSSILNDIEQSKLHFAICDDLIRSIKGLFIGQYCTLIDDIVFLFFGTINDYQLILSEQNLLKLRTKLNACLRRKLQSLGCDQLTTNDYYAFNLLVKIFSSMK